MEAGVAQRKRLMENVALLYALKPVLDAPQEFSLPTDGLAHVLSMRIEDRLAGHLAYLFCVKKDPSRINAVAIQQDSLGTGITIRVASNTGDMANEFGLFSCIAQLLQEIRNRSPISSRADRQQLVARMLSYIVHMDKQRILTRLRSRHAVKDHLDPRRSKPQKIAQLLRVANDIRRNKPSRFESVQVRRMLDLIQDLGERFERLEGGPAPSEETIFTIIRLFFDLRNSTIDDFLGLSSSINDRTRIDLAKGVRNLSRYYEIAVDLVKMVQDTSHEAFRSISCATTQTKPIENKKDLNSLMTKDITTVSQRIGVDLNDVSWPKQSIQAAKHTYAKRRNHTPNGWKTHAEVKIISFYDTHPELSRPRVIRSNKSCCYLCGLFIECHGGYYHNSCHGVVYDKWMLPGASNDMSVVSNFEQTMELMNSRLEKKIRSILAQPPSNIPQPFESPCASLSTLRSYQPAQLHGAQGSVHGACTSQEQTPRAGPSTLPAGSSPPPIDIAASSPAGSIRALPIAPRAIHPRTVPSSPRSISPSIAELQSVLSAQPTASIAGLLFAPQRRFHSSRSTPEARPSPLPCIPEQAPPPTVAVDRGCSSSAESESVQQSGSSVISPFPPSSPSSSPQLFPTVPVPTLRPLILARGQWLTAPVHPVSGVVLHTRTVHMHLCADGTADRPTSVAAMWLERGRAEADGPAPAEPREVVDLGSVAAGQSIKLAAGGNRDGIALLLRYRREAVLVRYMDSRGEITC